MVGELKKAVRKELFPRNKAVATVNMMKVFQKNMTTFLWLVADISSKGGERIINNEILMAFVKSAYVIGVRAISGRLS